MNEGLLVLEKTRWKLQLLTQKKLLTDLEGQLACIRKLKDKEAYKNIQTSADRPSTQLDKFGRPLSDAINRRLPNDIGIRIPIGNNPLPLGMVLLVQRGEHGSPAINPEQVIKLLLIVAAPTGTVNLLDRARRSEGDLGRTNTHGGAVLFVHLMDVARPVPLECVPHQHGRGEFGVPWSRDLVEWGGEHLPEVVGGEEAKNNRDEEGGYHVDFRFAAFIS